MTDEDTRKAAAALTRWFKSQSIGMADAASVMVVLIAGILAETADDDLELVGALAAFNGDLAQAIKIERKMVNRRSNK